ncbi:transglycosylase SLT domain-containing protein [Luteimonas sp. SX5]|uniref:Transglycosylase SLT domain-containing protein n=1 Tax=Luteimonas galliterrae TaxID=2940486 RepID=A0ABT0MEJ9_9GAMM|nr:transglycosylase SLT domain-containing protein [Luteimonas galliterrae]MCL1633301.1 transglycosylase SLT domain-containing protein [Luteimonas galliterrae]
MPSFALAFRFAPLAAALALVLISPDAAAASKREQAVAALNARMTAAEKRYRDALVKIGNNDPVGVAESNAALEDMEDAVDACSQQKGCEVTNMVTVYKRLLKTSADAQGQIPDEADDPSDLDPDHAGDIAFSNDVPEAAKAASLLDDKRHRFDKMVQYNPAVQAGIRRWLTDMRPSLMDSYENYQYMRQLMSPSFERAGLPEALLFGIMAKESNGKVHVTSRAGAAGPMQFMYATGLRFGLGQDGTGFDTRYDPHAVADASAAYLNERMGELNRSIEMALAAYNGGEGRALRIYNASEGRGFWDADVYNQFPAETRDYVPMVIAAAWLFLHPKKYGITFPRVESKYAPLRLAKPTSIYELTICLGSGGTRDGFMRALRNLNPRYQPDSYLPAGASLNATAQIVGLYNRHCVQGARAELAKQLVLSDPNSAIVRTGPVETLPPSGGIAPAPLGATPSVAAASKPKNPGKHKVAKNETLVSIAQRYQCDTKSLAKANGLKAPRYALRSGQTLKLQGCRE